MASCPECEGTVVLTEPPQASEIVECSECMAELEVVTAEPLTLAPAPEVEEDWGE
ncbi:MAG TPA: lysine biosynthesis protein LysW [Streptosporangiaceae bacterium]